MANRRAEGTLPSDRPGRHARILPSTTFSFTLTLSFYLSFLAHRDRMILWIYLIPYRILLLYSPRGFPYSCPYSHYGIVFDGAQLRTSTPSCTSLYLSTEDNKE